MALELEVITPQGRVLREAGLDEIVVRRREPGFDAGSEVAVFPRHAPLLMQTAACAMRLVRQGETRRVGLGPGLVEVADDRVTVLVHDAAV